MLLFGLLQTFMGFAVCFWGSSMVAQTAQFPGNARIRAGSVIMFLGAMCFTFGGLTVFMSL